MTVVTKYCGYAWTVSRPINMWYMADAAEGVEDRSCAYAPHGGYTRVLYLEQFGFSLPSDAVITEVLVIAKCGVSIVGSECLRFDAWDGSDYVPIGWTQTHAGNCNQTDWVSSEATSVLDTYDKVNAAKLRVRYIPSGGSNGDLEMQPWTGYLDACKIQVTYYVPTAGVPKRKLMGVGA